MTGETSRRRPLGSLRRDAEGADGIVHRNVEGRSWHEPPPGLRQDVAENLQGASEDSPSEVVATWRERFPEISGFEEGFRVPSGGLAPAPSRCWGLSGVMVLYSDETSFTYMTPEGHPFRVGSPSAPTATRTAPPWPRPNCSYAPTTRSTSS